MKLQAFGRLSSELSPIYLFHFFLLLKRSRYIEFEEPGTSNSESLDTFKSRVVAASSRYTIHLEHVSNDDLYCFYYGVISLFSCRIGATFGSFFSLCCWSLFVDIAKLVLLLSRFSRTFRSSHKLCSEGVWCVSVFQVQGILDQEHEGIPWKIANSWWHHPGSWCASTGDECRSGSSFRTNVRRASHRCIQISSCTPSFRHLSSSWSPWFWFSLGRVTADQLFCSNSPNRKPHSNSWTS